VIAIAERRHPFAFEVGENTPRDIGAMLFGYRRHAGWRIAVGNSGGIAE